MDVVPVSLEAGAAFLPAAALLAALWEQGGVGGSKAVGAFNADPLGTLMRDGALPQAVDVALLDMTDLAAWTASHLPNVRSVRVSTAVYHHAGADSVQDLAFAVGTAVEYLRAMAATGLEFNTGVRQITFHETVGSRFFQAIAKLRALRKLWAKAIEPCGADAQAASGLRVIVETSRRVVTHRDPWVNLLRNTAATFAGAVGGADAIITLPMDVAVGLSDESARRLARKTQLILQEECHLNQTVDPAGGSWFLESLTDEMAGKAWSLFQQIEGQGGMIKAATGGWIRDLSAHPDVFEKELSRPNPNYAELRAKAAARLVKWRHDHSRGSSIAALGTVGARSGRGIGELMASAVQAARAGATIGELTSTLAGPGPNHHGASTTPLTATRMQPRMSSCATWSMPTPGPMGTSGPGSSWSTWGREGSFSLARTTRGTSSKRAASNPWKMTASPTRRPPAMHSLRPARRSPSSVPPTPATRPTWNKSHPSCWPPEPEPSCWPGTRARTRPGTAPPVSTSSFSSNATFSKSFASCFIR
jgi:methylmalonyl-CoA mutase N-terminal domain/subunit